MLLGLVKKMKYYSILLFLLAIQILGAQEAHLSYAYKKEVIGKVSELITEFYIYPEVAEKAAVDLQERMEAGEFNEFEEDASFAIALTEVLQGTTKDKHLRVMSQNNYRSAENALERRAEQRMDQINSYRIFNQGFMELSLLEGNVAYLDLRGFAPLDRARETTDAYMKLMSQADAVIIDLTHNGGGDPSTVQYLCSFFFEEIIHLNSLYYRQGERTVEYWVLPEVGGRKMADIPMYVMISEETFSGAEEFSYNMLTQKRAVIVGQTSAGAANPGGTRGINEQLGVFIPTGRAVNPITNTSWEGVGVVPEIRTTREETFEVSLALAQEAARSRRESKLKKYIELHKELDKQLDSYGGEGSEEDLHKSISNFVDARLFGEWDINRLGYKYLMELNKPRVALCILKSNTILFPNSPNVFDSFGEAQRRNGRLEDSIKSYQKALDLAIELGDENISYYREALAKAKSEMAREPSGDD